MNDNITISTCKALVWFLAQNGANEALARGLVNEYFNGDHTEDLLIGDDGEGNMVPTKITQAEAMQFWQLQKNEIELRNDGIMYYDGEPRFDHMGHPLKQVGSVVFVANVYIEGKYVSRDFENDAAGAIALVEKHGPGSVTKFIRERNMPFCWPAVVDKSCGMWTFDSLGEWWQLYIWGAGDRLNPGKPA